MEGGAVPLDDVARRFAGGWVVTDGDRPLFGTDPDRPGIVTPLLPDRRTAVSLAVIVADGDDAWAQRLGVAPLGDPLDAMQALAVRGVVGWSPQGRWDGGAPARVRFAVRRHEVGAPFPTVIASGGEVSGWHVVLGSGASLPPADDVVAWVRYDVTDRAAITFRDGMPLGQVEAGAPLFEVLDSGSVVVVRDDSVAGPWGVACGAVRLVSDPDVAHHRCEALARSSSGGGGPYEVAAVTDLARRLAELAIEAPEALVTVNSHGHREHAAIAHGTRPRGVVPRWWEHRPELSGPVLRGPGGIWRIGPGNRFDLEAEAPGFSGGDTFFWDGSGSVAHAGGRAAVSWWEVARGPSSTANREFDSLGGAVAFVADLVEHVAGAGNPVVGHLRAVAVDSCPDLAAITRLVNLSGVGVFVEGIGGGEVGMA